MFGRQRPEGPSRQLELAENQRKTDAIVRLWRFGVISGTVTDESGEPMIGVTVRAMRRIYAGGRPRLGAGPQGTTDDRGMYRIASLPAGDYVVVMPNTTTTVANSAIDAYRAAISTGGQGGGHASVPGVRRAAACRADFGPAISPW